MSIKCDGDVTVHQVEFPSRFSGESRHASNLLPEPKFNFPKWNGGTSSAVSPTGNVDEDDEDDPIFDNSFVTNVTAQLGKSAHLQCTVLNIKQSNPVSARKINIEAYFEYFRSNIFVSITCF